MWAHCLAHLSGSGCVGRRVDGGRLDHFWEPRTCLENGAGPQVFWGWCKLSPGEVARLWPLGFDAWARAWNGFRGWWPLGLARLAVDR